MKLLAKGTFGEVYLSTNKDTGKPIAVKVIKMGNVDFIEIDIMRKIVHPSILSIQSIYSPGVDKLGYVLELADFSLRDVINKPRTMQFSEQDKIRLAYEIISGVDFLHKNGIAHNDIKPDNILIFNGMAKISDFGMSSYTDSRGPPIAQTSVYRAPELFFNSEDREIYQRVLPNVQYNPNNRDLQAGDIWAIGATLYELIARKDPHYLFMNDLPSESILDNINDVPYINDIFEKEGITDKNITKKITSLPAYYMQYSLIDLKDKLKYRGFDVDKDLVSLYVLIKGEGEIAIARGISKYIQDPNAYLTTHGVKDDKWKELLLTLMNPDAKMRPKSGVDILKLPLFPSTYSQPMNGYIKEGEKIDINCTSSDINEYAKLIYKNIVTLGDLYFATTFGTIDLYYRVCSRLPNVDKRLISICCLYIMASIYNMEKIPLRVVFGRGYSQEVINRMLSMIVEAVSGILVCDTLYTYAFSLDAVKKVIPILTNCEEYATTNSKEYMIHMEISETEDERNNRKPKKFAHTVY